MNSRFLAFFGIGAGCIAWLLLAIAMFYKAVMSGEGLSVDTMKFAPFLAGAGVVCALVKPMEQIYLKAGSFLVGASWLVTYYVVVKK